MKAFDRLMAHVAERPAQIRSLKERGTTIIGYVPNGYLPEELLYASGGLPLGLLRGGDHAAVIAAESCMHRFVDTFCRAQIGYRLLGKELLYQLPDLLVAAYTDRNQFAIGEMWQHYTEIPIFKVDVPRYNRAEHALAYYHQGLVILRRRLEQHLGCDISDADLNREIEVSNRIRSLLKTIGETRKQEVSPISGSQFVRLNHATYYADREVLTDALTSMTHELPGASVDGPPRVRLMVIGSTLAEGDYRAIEMLEQYGADIVFEEFAEGVHHYWQPVVSGDEPLMALAHRYLTERTPPAFFKNVYPERRDFYLDKIGEYRVDGVLWYSLLYRDSYDREAISFSRELQERGIPFLKISSDYDAAETEAMRTRIEAFLETIG
ncbi:2-hydroxyacyl-CoA dehydratase subunit D [Bacteroidota bacterium]